MTSISVRLATPEDYWEIDRLERECAQGTLLRFHFAPDDPLNPLPRALKFPDHIITVAVDADGKVVGTISGNVRKARVAENRYEKLGWLFSLRVSQTLRRSGAATKLVTDMEQRLNAAGAKMVFDSLAKDNTPSKRLFEKLGYRYMLNADFYGVNLGHANAAIDRGVKVQQGGNVTKLRRDDSKAFGKTAFMFPETDDGIMKSNVYVASKGPNDFVAINLWADSDRLGIVAIPMYLRILFYLLNILSFLLPNWVEKPLPLTRPWRIRWAYPVIINSSDEKLTRDLFNAAQLAIIRDLKANNGDVLNFGCEQTMSGLAADQYDLIREMPFVSPLMKGSGGCIQIVKALAPEQENANIVEEAARHPFWFMNNSL